MRRKHATAWRQAGKAWQKVFRGLVTKLMRESEVNAWTDNSDLSPLTVAMIAYTANVVRGARVAGAFPERAVSLEKDYGMRPPWHTDEDLPYREVPEPLRSIYLDFAQIYDDPA